MSSTHTQTKISLKDERLDIGQIDQYRLSFFISSGSCQISVFDIQKKRLLLLEEEAFKKDLSLTDNLQAIYHHHPLIAAGFWKEIQVFIRNKQFSLIPYPVFDKALIQQYIQLNEPTDPNLDEYRFKVMDELGTAIAFAYPRALKEWFRDKYPNTSLYFNHQCTAYLKGLNSQLRSKAQSSAYLMLNDEEALITGFNFSSITIYNQFELNDSIDLVKHILTTTKQYSGEAQSIPLLVHGTKKQIDKHLPTLKEYFGNVESGQRPSDIIVHPIFNQLEPMEYFDVLSNL